MKKFLYCKSCNDVFEISKSAPRKCIFDTHKQKAIITAKQYTNWIIQDKPILELKKKEN